jgi:hypothetical protein
MLTNDQSPLRRLLEAAIFFKAYGREILGFFLVFYVPVLLVNLVLPGMAGDAAESGGRLPLMSFFFTFLYQPVYTGALIYQLARLEAGQPWSVREGFIVGVTLWDKLLLVNLVSLAFTVMGLLAFIVPGLIAYARLSLAEFRVVIDRDRPKEALKGSFERTRPFTLQIIASTSVLFAIFLATEVVVERFADGLGLSPLLTLGINSLVSIVMLLNLTILLFRFYGLAFPARPAGMDA